MSPDKLPPRTAMVVFLVFAFAYFLSTLIRAITATLAPVLTQEFSLNARDLGLLAGAYFLGFSMTQLPMGHWLDRFGPKRVIVCFLMFAVLGCAAFSMATSFAGLLAARFVCGVGVSACLMAPLTGYRRWFAAGTQMRANSWMLMTGSLGMVASTLPVQWLIPVVGWRGLFACLALLVLSCIALIARLVPKWGEVLMTDAPEHESKPGYAEVWRHPYFRKMAPIGFFCYGGQIAMQTLWVVPWMVKVTGCSSQQAASGLFGLNVAMLCTFGLWGFSSPWLARRGLHADRLIALFLPWSFAFLAIVIIAGPALSTGAAAIFTLYCVSCTVVSLAQPAVSMAFAPALAGRALSAYNLLIFAGVFVVQWGIGLAVDGFMAIGLTEIQAFQGAMSGFLVCSGASYAYFLSAKSHNQHS